MANRRPLDEQAIYVISVAAELAGVHPQTLRIYERKGLLQPQRTAGNTRRYSEQDIATLRRIQQLTSEGINLAGVLRVMALEVEINRLRTGQMRAVAEARDASQRLIDVLAERGAVAMVPLRDARRMRRAMKSDALDEASRRRTFPAPPAAAP
ncbi:MAG: MerR family transcriptional regulator [Actinobacteria bacterium]|nr:MerR family transcriptional regulator [Actinomycetota bacterium]